MQSDWRLSVGTRSPNHLLLAAPVRTKSKRHDECRQCFHLFRPAGMLVLLFFFFFLPYLVARTQRRLRRFPSHQRHSCVARACRVLEAAPTTPTFLLRAGFARGKKGEREICCRGKRTMHLHSVLSSRLSTFSSRTWRLTSMQILLSGTKPKTLVAVICPQPLNLTLPQKFHLFSLSLSCCCLFCVETGVQRYVRNAATGFRARPRYRVTRVETNQPRSALVILYNPLLCFTTTRAPFVDSHPAVCFLSSLFVSERHFSAS